MENSSSCLNFSASDLHINTAVTITFHLIAVLACLVTILFIFVTKQHHFFVNRLILYLMIVASLWSIMLMAEVIPVTHDALYSTITVRPGWHGMCASIGFISQLVESVKILVVCWIVLYLFLLIVFKYSISSTSHEVAGWLIILVLPLLLDWLPFIWDSYGLSGMWCWIELTADDECTDFWKGLSLMLIVEYVPVLLAVLFTLVSFACIVITLCRRACRTDIRWKWTSVYQKGLREATALMVYPCIYAVIFTFRVIHRTYYIIQISNHTSPTYTLWLAHSAAMGIGGILVPFVYLMRPSNLKKFYLCRKFFLRKDSVPGVVYRSSSVVSTEVCSDGELFKRNEHDTSNARDSNLLYRSILNNQT